MNEVICDIFEALESMRLLKPVYLEILKRTGDRKQALEAIEYLKNLDLCGGSERLGPGAREIVDTRFSVDD